MAGARRRGAGSGAWAPTWRVYEKGDRPGGSMVLSSGVVWRYREWETFRAECPGGDPALQRVVWEGSTTRSPGSSPWERRWWRGRPATR